MKLRIKELREEMRLTQRELAEKISNSQRNVSNWENGTSEPDLETVIRLRDVFQVSFEELFGLSGGEPSAPRAEERGLLSRIHRLDARQKAALETWLDAFLA